jgi:polyglycine hydrolase-like protein
MALAFVAFGVGATPAAPPPNACQGQWTVPSPLQFQQGFKYYITLYLKQQGTTISGKAGYQIGSKVTVGNVGGSIKGNHFSARVFWTYSGGRGVGIYNGDIQPTGTIFQGTTWDQQANNGVTENFNSSSQTLFYCSPLPGYAEVSRMAVRDFLYQDEFDRFTKGGYRPVWIDGWRTTDGRNWFNVVFRPDDGKTPWVARHNLTGAQYQSEFDKWTKAGYRPLQIESYPASDGIRYAAIYVKTPGPPFLAYHARTDADHQARFNQLTAQGWVPVIISVAPWGGARYYTALYEKKAVGGFAAWQTLDTSQYQAQINQQAAAGRKLVYLNAYNDPAGPRFTAIWYSNAPVPYARHGIDPYDYYGLADAQRKNGLLTRAVTGYMVGSTPRYAAFWSK